MNTPSKTSMAIIGFMGVTGLGFTVILPIQVGTIVDQLGLDRSMIGWISSSNIIGLMIGTFVSTLLIGKISLTRIVQVGCLGLLIFDLTSTLPAEADWLMGLRFLSGLSGGLVYAASLAAFSGLKSSIHAFSIYIICYALISGLALFILPFLILSFGYESGFILLAIFALLSLLFLSRIDQFESLVKSRKFDSLHNLMLKPAVWLTTLSYFMLQLSGGVMYTYSERIGKEAGLTSELIGIVLSFGAFVAFIGAYIVIKMGNRFGTFKPVLIGIFLMGVSLYALFWSEIPWIYLLGVSLTGALWSFLLPFYQQIQARFDVLGRIVSVGTIVNMGGRATGPAIAAAFLGDMPFSSVLWLDHLKLSPRRKVTILNTINY